MLRIISGYISLLGLTVMLGLLAYASYESADLFTRDREFFSWLAAVVVCLSSLYFNLSSRFWNDKYVKLKNLELDNLILKKKIENKELTTKLTSNEQQSTTDSA